MSFWKEYDHDLESNYALDGEPLSDDSDNDCLHEPLPAMEIHENNGINPTSHYISYESTNYPSSETSL